MTSRERIATACAHMEPDRLPVDFGGGFQTGIHVSMVYTLRQALGLDPPGAPVKVVEVYQMLARSRRIWRPRWRGHRQPARHGHDVRVPADGFQRVAAGRRHAGARACGFQHGLRADGELRQWPENDRSVSPSGVMPAGGHFFDAIIRQDPIDEARLDPADNTEEFTLIEGADLRHYGELAERLWTTTDRALFCSFRRADVRRHRARAWRRPQAPARHPRHRGVVRQHRHAHGLHPRGLRAAGRGGAAEPGTPLRRHRRPRGRHPTNGTDFGTQNGPFCRPEEVPRSSTCRTSSE